ncbi:MAG: BtpA/SgcQ family protein [Planctomycetota bacterium]
MTRDLFGRDRAVIGMVHVHALPGTPRNDRSVRSIIEQAVTDADALARGGVDAILLENMHDVPYLAREVGPEIVAGMTVATAAVHARVDLPIGVQILAGANRAALAAALAGGATFIRAEGLVFSSVADEGLLAEADAGPLLRYRKAIGAEHIAVITDVKKKHSSNAITADVDLAETVRAAIFFGAAGVIVTGQVTGDPVELDHLRAARAATDAPVIVGSGATPDNAAALFEHADAIIVGSSIKRDGRWDQPVDEDRVRAFVAKRV